jgi:hypothetical protein
MYLAFFDFADKENWETQLGQKLNLWAKTKDYGFLCRFQGKDQTILSLPKNRFSVSP